MQKKDSLKLFWQHIQRCLSKNDALCVYLILCVIHTVATAPPAVAWMPKKGYFFRIMPIKRKRSCWIVFKYVYVYIYMKQAGGGGGVTNCLPGRNKFFPHFYDVFHSSTILKFWTRWKSLIFFLYSIKTGFK